MIRAPSLLVAAFMLLASRAAAQPMDNAISPRIQGRIDRILKATPLIDGHNDLAYLIRHHANGNVADYDLCRRRKKRD